MRTTDLPPTPAKPYAGLADALQHALAHPAQPLSDLRESPWPPVELDEDLEQAWRLLHRRETYAALHADQQRHAIHAKARGPFGAIPSQRSLAKLADAQTAHAQAWAQLQLLAPFRPPAAGLRLRHRRPLRAARPLL